MGFDLIKIIVLGIPVVFTVTVIYAYLLLAIARVFSGVVKFSVSMVLYLIFSFLMVCPMLYLINMNKLEIKESTTTLFAVLFGYAVMLAPAMYYLIKVKMKALQRAGYFQSRR